VIMFSTLLPSVRTVWRWFWGVSSPLHWYNNTEILCITRTVKHNYISLCTVGIQLHVSAL